MNGPNDCEPIREAWAAALAAGEPLSAEVASHLDTCAACHTAVAEMEALWKRLGALADAAPSGVLRRDFAAVLAGYREGMGGRATTVAAPAPPGRVAPFRRRSTRRRVYQLGYGLAALLAGMVLGVLGRQRTQGGEMSEMRAELRSLRQDVALSMLQQTSASARLEGVSVGAQVARQDPELLAALLDTLATDPSPNVRLAAVDALASRAAEPAVQQQLALALSKEASPLVQIAMADALLSADGARARRLVAPLASSPGVRQEVRQYVRQRLGMRT
ncbi:MAG TPA: hypothetical protein VGV61_04220 [Thermoanaerobaculia bacterium]|jgi:hypothetical protein|nr:hypothetical protein [Thermoanaerobaculia bacterium]